MSKMQSMNNKERNQILSNYLQQIKSANKELTKKEAFKDMLNRLYSYSEEVVSIINSISAGAEHTVLNIPRYNKYHRGSADTLYNNIIIEFENNLETKLKHAKEQLAGYFLGMFNSGEGYNYTLIVSDFINWKIFAPDISQIEILGELNENELILIEVESASFTLDETNFDDFYFWIDRFLFKEVKQRATLKRIEQAFGQYSNVFIQSIREMDGVFQEAKKHGEVQVAMEQWAKYLSIAYGSFDASDKNYLIHTYLSIFSKLIGFAVVSRKDYIPEDELRLIMNGEIFLDYNIANFVEHDFYNWVNTNNNFKNLISVFRRLAQEIVAFDYDNVDEDILKGVYQELIDIDTRHSLGEYYTPDWLCERILQEYDINEKQTLLDPSCGSGSFLRAVIHRIKYLNPSVNIEDINSNVYGIDIHPLSVQVAKTTLLLAYGKELQSVKRPLHLNVILANTLLAPDGIENIFEDEFSLSIDKQKVFLPIRILNDVKLFDQALNVCEDLANQTMNQKSIDIDYLELNLEQRINAINLSEELILGFYSIYEKFKLVKEKGRNGIWKFVLQNLYKPYFLKNHFDFIVGNPPWFTFSAIKNEEYQNLLNKLAIDYSIKPQKIANFPHLEIAAIFMSYCSSYFLKDNGNIAFVLPRSFFSADHHENTRNGKAKGFKVNKIWDLIGVEPLFNIPSSVFFAKKNIEEKRGSIDKIIGVNFQGRIPTHNSKWVVAKDSIVEEESLLFNIKLGKSSALSAENINAITKPNPYKKQFRQGATLVPRSLFFVDLLMHYPPDWDDRILTFVTSKENCKDAKAPWKDLKIRGQIESRFVFKTALAKSILPFALINPQFVLLPIFVRTDETGKKSIEVCSRWEVLGNGYLSASGWFQKAERMWDEFRTEKNRKHELHKYLDWQNKLSTQNLNAPYLVIYTASAKDANATIVKREDIDVEFIVESKAYVFYTDEINEAYYLTAILNSKTPNKIIKPFQTRGLFGPRDIHKRILNVYFPKFNKRSKKHIKIAELGEICHLKATEFVNNWKSHKKIEGLELGKLRLAIREHLDDEINQIDEILSQLLD